MSALQSRQESDRAAENALKADRNDIKALIMEMEAANEEHVK